MFSCESPGALTAVLHKGADWVVVLVFEVGRPKDAFLDILKGYINSESPAEHTYAGMSESDKWWEPHSAVAKKMR